MTLIVPDGRDRLVVEASGSAHGARAGRVERLGVPRRSASTRSWRCTDTRACGWRRSSPRSASTCPRSSSIPSISRRASRSRPRAASPRSSSSGSAATRRWDGRSTPGRSSPARCRRRRSSKTCGTPATRSEKCCADSSPATSGSSFHYFEFPDRVGHVFWRFRDPQHPAYDAALASRYGDAVEKSYAHDGRDRRRDGEGAEARGRPARSFRSRLRDVAPVRQLQLVAGRERLSRPQGRRAASEPRGAFLAGPVLGGGRLVEVEGLRDGPRRHLRQPAGPGTGRHRRARRRVRGAAQRALRAPDRADGPQDQRKGGLPRLQAGRRLPPLRSAADPRSDRREPPGLPRVVAVLPRRADRDRSSRTTATSGAATTARSIPTSCAASFSRPGRSAPIRFPASRT